MGNRPTASGDDRVTETAGEAWLQDTHRYKPTPLYGGQVGLQW